MEVLLNVLLLCLSYKALTVLFLLYFIVHCSPVITSWVLGLHSTCITKTIRLQNNQRIAAGGSLGGGRKEEAD